MANSTDKTKESRFPVFEPTNFLGWKRQFEAHLRGLSATIALQPRPTAVIGADGVERAPNTAAERRELERLQELWDKADDKAFPALMEACRPIPTVKTLSEEQEWGTAINLLERLQARYRLADPAFQAA